MSSRYHKGGAGTDSPTYGERGEALLRAEAKDWPPDDLAGLLQRNEAGDKKARELLVEGAMKLFWEMYDTYSPYKKLSNNPASTLLIKLSDCFKNLPPGVDPADVEGILQAKLFGKKGSKHRYVVKAAEQKDFVSVKVPKGTNRKRRQKGLAPYTGFKRGCDLEHVDSERNHILGNDYHLNDDPEKVDDADAVWSACKTEDEKAIMRLHLMGSTHQEIADDQFVTVYRVKQTITTVKERVEVHNVI